MKTDLLEIILKMKLWEDVFTQTGETVLHRSLPMCFVLPCCNS